MICRAKGKVVCYDGGVVRRKKIFFLVIYSFYLILVWAVFRLLVHLPEAVEELMFRPVLWLSPLWWWRLAQGKKYKLIYGKVKEGWRWGLGGGVALYLLFRLLTGRSVLPEMRIDVLATSFAIGIVQGLTFLGGISTIISMITKNEILNQVVTGLVMAFVQLPIGLLVYKLNPVVLLGTFLITFFVGIITVNIRLKSKNTLAALMAYWFFILAVI